MNLKKTTSLIIALLMISLILFSGCSVPQGQTIKKKIPKPPEGKNVRIAIALSPPGKGDQATNDEALAGLAKAKENLGIEYKVIEPKELVDEEETINYLAENNFDLVIVVGYPMVKPLNKVAPLYPDINFAILDEEVDQPNVTSITFREQEGSFLAGVLAANVSQSKIVGFIGGADLDLIHKYESGYKQGVNYVNTKENKKVQVLANYLGLTIDAFNDAQLGRNMANTEISNGADVIYHAARNSASGIIDSCKAAKRLVIGSDINQNNLAPGTIYASMTKKTDEAVYQSIEKLIKGELKHGTISYGLAEKGVALEFSPGIPQDIIDRVNGVQQSIIKGEIKVEEKINDQINQQISIKMNPTTTPDLSNNNSGSSANKSPAKTPLVPNEGG